MWTISFILTLYFLQAHVLGYIKILEPYLPPDKNVLLMIADDLGIGDLGCYGNKKAKTPNLDKLAKHGIRFTRMYSVPSDAGSMNAIMSGREPRRFGLVKGKTGRTSFSSPAQTGGIHEKQYTLARAGNRYRVKTLYNGLWNLGFSGNKIPTQIGFRSFFGTLLPHSVSCVNQDRYTDSDMFKALMYEYYPIFISISLVIVISRYFRLLNRCLFILSIIAVILSISALRIHCWTSVYNPSSCIFMENNVIQEQPYREDRMMLRMTDQAVRFMKYRANHIQPFLYIVSFLQPGFPSATSFKFRNRTALGPHGDSVHEMDWSVGKILKALKDSNLQNDTIVIFVSNNSPTKTHPVSGEPLDDEHTGQTCIYGKDGKIDLRGEKGSNFEGGLRVPAIIHYPGKTRKESVTHAVTSVMDVYATIYDIWEMKKTEEETKIDGKSLMPLIKNPKLTPSNVIHEQLYHYCDLGKVGAVTLGDLKIHFRNSTLKDCAGPLLSQPLVYNISGDPRETNPLPIKDYIHLLYHVEASVKKYQSSVGLNVVKHSQFDEIPMPFNFPCDEILFCSKTYDIQENFNTLLY
ncbi:hypothetical protein FSP39_021689 [Pinctada imbricata]|uniref:Sulfatase N-terminal domain-containing protein n=1 Tax=Pinctada imbricata TaxID=66713 RepID=A0AA89BTI2_PINIB|nr:hypothetical protein FSP39_021689 [Pinctada imbricata]